MDKLISLLTPNNLLWAAAILILLFLLREYRRQRHPIRVFLMSSGSGLAALLLAHFFGDVIGFSPPFSLFTIGISAVLGVPGVLLLAAIHFFL
ncbi:MAG: pro-sigmaK processing inhibitor BofA family protein [Oscillospiraceae bacterium]|nr:pro-sigmaK processing inhibitor BofA family protein [Oscillospiraceae bacterium]